MARWLAARLKRVAAVTPAKCLATQLPIFCAVCPRFWLRTFNIIVPVLMPTGQVSEHRLSAAQVSMPWY
jgi:hypothetical protein